MEYKIINTDLLLNGKLIPEGSEIELSKEEVIGIESYLQPLVEDKSTTTINKKSNIKKEK